MATVKKNKTIGVEEAGSSDSLWREPITLDSFEDNDPLEALYRGREVGNFENNAENPAQTEAKNPMKTAGENAKKPENPALAPPTPSKSAAEKTPEDLKAESTVAERKIEEPFSPKISEEELKNILKIRSDSFQFTDIREILRGKSFDIYAYLRLLAGDSGVCKIKHLDLMKKLDISRPTLFKQGDWLSRLQLIEKRSVPGDHLGTSYTVYLLEDILPISENLIRQLESHIQKLERELD